MAHPSAHDPARPGAVVSSVVAVVLPLLLVLHPPPGGVRALATAVAVELLVATLTTVAWLAPQRLPRWTWSAWALGGVGVVLVLHPSMPDTPALGFAALTLDTIFASAFLGRRTARAVTAASLGAVAVIAGTRFDPEVAVLHLLLVGGSLVALHVLLCRLRTTQEEVVDDLHRRASVDELTGLVARGVFRSAAQAMVHAAVRAERDLALVLVDVDDFKTVNDRWGHPVGDLALQHLADVLRHGIRADDAVIGRLGGDELALLLPGCSRAAALARSEDLVQAVRDRPLLLPDGRELPLRVSVGVAVAPAHGRTFAELYTAADEALYAAKRGGRDRASVAA